MSHHKDSDTPVSQDEPSEKLEEKLKRDPDDKQTKVDVGSDESMDASDPISVTQGDGEDRPHPNSDAPKGS